MPRAPVLVLVLAVVVAGCSAGVDRPSRTTTPTPTTDGPCSFDRPETDALGNAIDWPVSPETTSPAGVRSYVAAFERAYVQWTGTTESMAVDSEVGNVSAERRGGTWRVRLSAARWLSPQDTPEEMHVQRGRRPYTVTYVLARTGGQSTPARAWRLEHSENTTPATARVRSAALVACPTLPPTVVSERRTGSDRTGSASAAA